MDAPRLWEIWLSRDGEAWEPLSDEGQAVPHRYSDWGSIQREAEHWAAQLPFVLIRTAPGALDRDSLNTLRSVGPAGASEADHFQLCPICGQTFDRRRLGDVMHHMKPGHPPLPVDP